MLKCLFIKQKKTTFNIFFFLFCLEISLRFFKIETLNGGTMRKKVKGKLYYMAKDAKSRMRNFNKEKSIFDQIPYARACFGVREQELYEKVCKILERDEIVINPIKELVDYKYYNTLSLEAKQKYIFDLSEKYKALKIRYEKEHEILASASNI